MNLIGNFRLTASVGRVMFSISDALLDSNFPIPVLQVLLGILDTLCLWSFNASSNNSGDMNESKAPMSSNALIVLRRLAPGATGKEINVSVVTLDSFSSSVLNHSSESESPSLPITSAKLTFYASVSTCSTPNSLSFARCSLIFPHLGTMCTTMIFGSRRTHDRVLVICIFLGRIAIRAAWDRHLLSSFLERS